MYSASHYRFVNRDKINRQASQYRRKHRKSLAAKQRRYYRKNKPKVIAYIRRWQSQNQKKMATYEIRKRSRSRREYAKNRLFWKRYRRRYYLKNLKKKRSHWLLKTRLYHAKKVGNGGKTTKEEWLKICRRQKWKCAVCKKRKKLTMDHIIPVTKGGTSWPSNIQGACRSCNSRKRDRIIHGATSASSSCGA